MERKKSGKAGRVRTTVTLEPDVAKMLDSLQRERGQGLSEVLNDVLRRSAASEPARAPFVQRTSPIGITGPVYTGEILGMDDDQRFPVTQ